ncbi:hypothetical protein NA56DRAFT_706972 [Hyaloscypha hepaticicola]|uniref:Uncharacterized protein n=1 Tax=Hyaloscypha hepaticicola TaxID=2082293 RepID=A0A2J6PWG2_9HELO|nr:hypothetical protein NA56DRAFT_706972 [Hyaloscypha hepaticicola]
MHVACENLRTGAAHKLQDSPVRIRQPHSPQQKWHAPPPPSIFWSDVSSLEYPARCTNCDVVGINFEGLLHSLAGCKDPSNEAGAHAPKIPQPIPASYETLDIALLGEPVASQPYTVNCGTSFALAPICTANSHAVSSKKWPRKAERHAHQT